MFINSVRLQACAQLGHDENYTKKALNYPFRFDSF